jgi:hypothetical protein
MAIEKPKQHKPPGTDQIQAGLIKVVGGTIESVRSINLLIHKKGLRMGRNLSLYLFLRRGIQQIVELQRNITFVSYIQKFIQHPPVKVNFVCRENY